MNDNIHNYLPKMIIGRWQQLVDGLDYSTNDFYNKLEAQFNRRNVPDLQMGRVVFRQKGHFSDRREYLRLIRNEFIFDICACPMGDKAFFVSYWHGFLRFKGVEGWLTRLLLMVPVIGYFLEKTLIPNSYHYTDSTDMFQELAHLVVIGTVNEVSTDASLPPLTKDQQKPVLKNLLNI